MWNIFNWWEYNSLGENYFVERQSCKTIDSKGMRFLRFGSLSWQNGSVSTIRNVLDTELGGSRSLQNIVNWTVLMENQSCSSGKFSTTHNTAVTLGNPKNDGEEWNSARKDQRSNHVHVDVQWHCVEKRKHRILHVEFFRRCCIRREISWRTLVIHRTRIGRIMARSAHSQTNRFVRRCGWSDDD